MYEGKSFYLNLRMVSNTSKDALRHPTNDASRVPIRLIHAKLDILLPQKKRTSTQELSTRLSSNTSPSAPFRKDERDSFVEQRLGGQPEFRGFISRDGSVRKKPWC